MSAQNLEVVFLRGKKVVLRPISKSDIPWFTKWINDPEVNCFLMSYLPKTEEDENEWYENISKHNHSDVLLVIVVDQKPIGLMGLHNINWADRTATTGAMIGEKEYWNKGCGTEAKMLLLNYAFNALNLRKICSSVLEFNKRSYHYICNCGYKVEGRLKRQVYKKGRYWDEILLAVFKKDWQPTWKKWKKDNL